MKRYIFGLLLIPAFFFSVMDFGVLAQGRPGAGEEPRRPVVSVRRLTGTGNRAEVLTPYYDSSYGRSSRPAREWHRILVEYDSYPDWIDDLTIAFYAISVRADGGQNRYTYYRREVRYMDIERDTGHRAVAYLRPSAVERYGDVVAAAVEFIVDGEVVAMESDSRLRDALPPDWWKNERVVKSELVTIREGYLLNRLESPFAYVNIDDYEAIK
jgi:hypothetical protein